MHRRRLRAAARRLATFLSVLAATAAVPALAAANTFTVVSSDDIGVGTCPTPSTCNLRQAINSANASPGSDRIVFDIPPGGPQTIMLTQTLPAIVESVEIDGTTQPGYLGTPIVEVDGTASAGNGFQFERGANVVAGMVMNRFALAAAISVRRGSAANVFRNNYLGTDLTGTVALPNKIGLQLSETERNLVGGRTLQDRNVISGNTQDQVSVEFGGGGNIFEGNYIGIDATSTNGLGGRSGIITINAPSTTIGGVGPGARNVISVGPGAFAGVWFFGRASSNSGASDNFIGTDATGTRAVGQFFGVYVDNARHAVIGQATAEGGGNVISGNRVGIAFASNVGDFPEDGVVVANFVGTDVTGTLPVPNSITGMTITGRNHQIGGIGGGERNLVSGNGSDGILLGSTTGTRVEANWVGVDVNRAPLPNGGSGIGIDTGSGNMIGGTGPGTGNLIAYNLGNGVGANAGVSNGILGNSIHDNARLGIDLGSDGVTPNDPGDADVGANERQNYPILSPIHGPNGNRQVDGVLNSHPNTTYRIEIFRNDACDPSGFGEGQTLIGTINVTTDATGTATFSFAVGNSPSEAITATATDPANNTSEFSNCSTGQPPVVGSVTTLSPAASINDVGTSHTVTATVVTPGPSPAPLAGVTVYFTVTGSIATTLQCTTDANGQCSVTYQGPAFPGADLITGCADSDGNGSPDANDVCGTATKVWMLPASTPGQVTGGGRAPSLGGGEIAFGFNAQTGNSGVKGNCNVVDQSLGVHLKCVTVTNLIVAGTHAAFFGQATVGGVTTNYRIDVDDLGEPGASRDTFKVQTDSGYVAGGVLTAGNIQIHN